MKDYIEKAIRTESKLDVESLKRMTYNSRAIHAFLGLSTEIGELADEFKKHLFYNQTLDMSNIVEEVGDLLWYIAILLDHCGVKDITKCMEANIQKLKKRYP